MNLKAENAERLFLGIEGGGTRTVALLAAGDGAEVQRVEAGPANLKLLRDGNLIQHLASLKRELPRPDGLGIGLAGAWTEFDRNRIRAAAARVWPGVPCFATNDLETALAAGGETLAVPRLPQVLIVSGTGSCCYGNRADGQEIKVGGWGHLLGDKGSGYETGLRALKAAIYYYDQDGIWPKLGQRILRALQLNEPDDLIGWAQAAAKRDIAGLAVEVFAAWEQKDKIASDILHAAANSLARDAAICASRVTGGKRKVEFILSGSVLLKQPRFASLVGSELNRLWPANVLTRVKRQSVWGAVELAKRFFNNHFEQSATEHRVKTRSPRKDRVRALASTEGVVPKVVSSRLPPTEMRNRRSMHFDKLSIDASVKLMLSEDATISGKLMAERGSIQKAVKLIVRSFRRHGRLFYVGAGTSGRLGVLDASECPPTFRTDPELVQGIIAGGEAALRKSIEGAEDDVRAGARTISFHGVGPRDVVVGIAASGTTPFVWGALKCAKQHGARAILICFNPYLEIPRAIKPSVVIAPNLGPELLTGSTRLKAGTATKLILNIFTTVAMVQTGKVMSNLMIDLHPANVKLRDRAARIVQDLTKADYNSAWQALEKSGWVIKKAVGRLRRK
jgi:N-acetylmuramic acid 6-phosphate etherase